MRRLGLVVLASFLSTPAVLAAANIPPSGFVVKSQRQVHTGVEYATIARSGPLSAVVHVAHIAPSATVDLRLVTANDKVSPDQAERELTSSMCNRAGCAVGINAGFWDPDVTTAPAGGVVTGGRMLRSPGTDPQVTLTRDGRFTAGALEWSARVVGSDGSPLAITAINRPVDGIVLITPEWGDTSVAGPGAELVLQPAGPLGVLNQSVAVDVLSLRDRGGDLPAGTAVLAGTGTGEATLRQLWDRLSSGDRRLTLTVSSPLDAVESIGSHLVLLEDGSKVPRSETDTSVFTRLHRTVLGWNAAGDVFMVAVDAGTGDSQGMSLSDASNLLLNLGATDAVEFDGDGGTTLVVEGDVANRPRTDDGDVERPAMSAFVAVPRGGGPRVTPPAPGPEPAPPPPPPPPSGYWMVASDGAVFAFGEAPYEGGMSVADGARAVDLEPTPSSKGYWIVDDAGNVAVRGDAPYLGTADKSKLAPGEKVTSLSATPSGEGYWLFTDGAGS